MSMFLEAEELQLIPAFRPLILRAPWKTKRSTISLPQGIADSSSSSYRKLVFKSKINKDKDTDSQVGEMEKAMANVDLSKESTYDNSISFRQNTDQGGRKGEEKRSDDQVVSEGSSSEVRDTNSTAPKLAQNSTQMTATSGSKLSKITKLKKAARGVGVTTGGHVGQQISKKRDLTNVMNIAEVGGERKKRKEMVSYGNQGEEGSMKGEHLSEGLLKSSEAEVGDDQPRRVL